MDAEWGLVCPFWIDTDAYTDRDREMFVCGVEFQTVYADLKFGWEGKRPVHRENESRFRMLLGKLGIRGTICPIADCEGWSELTVEDNDAN